MTKCGKRLTPLSKGEKDPCNIDVEASKTGHVCINSLFKLQPGYL